MSNLSLCKEWINQNKVQPVITLVSCTLASTSWHVTEVSAALDLKIVWVESNVLKLVEV